MVYYIRHDENGEIAGWGCCSKERLKDKDRDGLTTLEIDKRILRRDISMYFEIKDNKLRMKDEV